MSHESVLVFAPKGVDPEDVFIKIMDEDETHMIGGRFSGLLGKKDYGIKSDFDFKKIARRLERKELIGSVDCALTEHIVDMEGNFLRVDTWMDDERFWKIVNEAPDDANVALIDWHY